MPEIFAVQRFGCNASEQLVERPCLCFAAAAMGTRAKARTWLGLLGLCSLGCGAPEPAENTGGTTLPPGACGRGSVVVSSDYQSTNVSLVDLDGKVLSESFLSSGTTAAGLSAPLSGDVALPSTSASGDEIVVIDRYPASVLTWVGVADGQVRGQLSVKTGFAANPKDYLRLEDGRAYVSRFEPNSSAGKEPFDAGDDIVVLAADHSKIETRLDLASAMSGEAPEFFVRPSRMLEVGGRVLVLSQGYTKSYDAEAPSRLIAIDPKTDSIERVLVLDGAHGCIAMALAPGDALLALSCAGEFAGGDDPRLDSSAVVLVDPVAMKEVRRFEALNTSNAPFGYGIGFMSAEQLIVTTLGREDISGQASRPDRVLSLPVAGGPATELLRSDRRVAVVLDVRCYAQCERCFVTDAERGVLHHVRLGTDGQTKVTGSSRVEQTIGEPRALGAF